MRQFFLQLVSILPIIYLFFFQAKVVSAQVVINEVQANPASGNDWVELKNTSEQVVHLTGWSLEDSTSLMTPVPSLSTQVLSPLGFLVLEVGNRLNNTGDQVRLKNASNSLIDSFSFSQTVSDESWSRFPDGIGEFALAIPSKGTQNGPVIVPSPSPSLSLTPTATPAASASPTPTLSPNPSTSPSLTPSEVLPAHIIISEIMACPNTGESEWVELQNLDLQGYELRNWQLKDNQNNSRYFSLPISSQGFSVVQLSPAMLNNTGGDQISVIRPDGITTHWASYVDCSKGQSLVLSGEKWIPAIPSPGAENPEQATTQADTAEVNKTEQPATTQENPTKKDTDPSAEQTATNTALIAKPRKRQTSPPTFVGLPKSNLADDLDQVSERSIRAFSTPSNHSILITDFILPLILSTVALGYPAWQIYAWYTEKRVATSVIFD